MTTLPADEVACLAGGDAGMLACWLVVGGLCSCLTDFDAVKARLVPFLAREDRVVVVLQ